MVKLQNEWPHGEVTLITQNIDGLLTKAGANVYEIHGNATYKFCENCGYKSDYNSDIHLSDKCHQCGKAGCTRPFVVMFGEMPCFLDIVQKKLEACDIFVVIGSSLEVSPGNLFVYAALENNAETYLINKEIPTGADLNAYQHRIYGPSTIEVPKWVDAVLNTSNF